jgi:hypothetical protein
MRGPCRLGVRSPTEKSVLLLGLTANKSARRIHGLGQAGGPSGIRTCGTVLKMSFKSRPYCARPAKWPVRKITTRRKNFGLHPLSPVRFFKCPLAMGERVYRHHHSQRKPLAKARSEKPPPLNVETARNSLSQWPARATAVANRRKCRYN